MSSKQVDELSDCRLFFNLSFLRVNSLSVLTIYIALISLLNIIRVESCHRKMQCSVSKVRKCEIIPKIVSSDGFSVPEENKLWNIWLLEYEFLDLRYHFVLVLLFKSSNVCAILRTFSTHQEWDVCRRRRVTKSIIRNCYNSLPSSSRMSDRKYHFLIFRQQTLVEKIKLSWNVKMQKRLEKENYL